MSKKDPRIAKLLEEMNEQTRSQRILNQLMSEEELRQLAIQEAEENEVIEKTETRYESAQNLAKKWREEYIERYGNEP